MKVYCCKRKYLHLNDMRYRDPFYECLAEQNIEGTWYSEGSRRQPKELNINNDCTWFEEYED